MFFVPQVDEKRPQRYTAVMIDGAESLGVLFDALDRELSRSTKEVHLVVVGGSALLAHGFIDRPTRDVDVVALVKSGSLVSSEPLPPHVLSASARVAQNFGLAADWLNGGPTSLLAVGPGLPDGFVGRLIRTFHGDHLTVSIAARDDLVSLKLYALADRRAPRDESDLRALAATRRSFLPPLVGLARTTCRGSSTSASEQRSPRSVSTIRAATMRNPGTALREALLAFCAEQWAQVGVSVSRHGGPARATCIDLEPLLLLTLEVARDDPRLFDEVLDWCARNTSLLSPHRLRTLCASDTDQRMTAALLRWLQPNARGSQASPGANEEQLVFPQLAPPSELEPAFASAGCSARPSLRRGSHAPRIYWRQHASACASACSSGRARPAKWRDSC